MRHGKKFKQLSRTNTHRKAMLSNMASSLIMHKRIKTTLAKAKALRTYIEPLITKSKEDSTHSRRMVFSYLQDKDAVNELFREISVKVAERQGGYTRILKLGHRFGDNAEMCIMELVDFNENMLAEKPLKPKKTRRSRRGGGSKSSSKPQPTEAIQEEKTDEVKETAPKSEEDSKAEADDTVKEKNVEKEKDVTAKEEKKEEPKAEAKEEKKQEPKAEADNKSEDKEKKD